MAQKTVKKPKTAVKTKTRKSKAKKVTNARFVCRVCNTSGKGGYFSAADEKGMKCPHCGSVKVKLLG